MKSNIITSNHIGRKNGLLYGLFLLLALFIINPALAAWAPMNGPGGGQISSFEFVSDSEIWASSQEGLVYRTTDGGTSWKEVAQLKSSETRNNRLTLQVDSSGKYYAHIGRKLFSSTDSGSSWTLLADNISGFYIDGKDQLYKYPAVADGAGNLYVMNQRRSIKRSTDGGVTWTEVTGLGKLPISLASDSAGNLYAGYIGALYVSSDNGTSWSQKTAVTQNIGHFSFSAGVVYAKVGWTSFDASSTYWQSTDNGATWSSILLPQSDTLINHLDAAPNGDLYINTFPRYNRPVFNIPNTGGGRVMKVSAGTTSFVDLNNGLGHVSVSHIVESGGNLIVAAAYGNLWLSSDSGSSWSVPATAPVVGVYGLGVAGGTAYAMTSSGFYRSTDNGVSWSVVNASETGHYSEFASDSNGRLYIYGEGGFKYSDDGGTSWMAANTGCTGRPSDSNNQNALAVSSNGQNIHVNECYSNDGGSSWATATFPDSLAKVHSLAMDASGNLFAGMNIGGVVKSTDGGVSYVKSNGGMDTFGNASGGLSTMFVDSRNTLYTLSPYGVGAYLSGVWSSTDGANWARDNNGLPTIPMHGEFGALTLAETGSGKLILSTAGSGLFSKAFGPGIDTTAPVVTAPADITVDAASVQGTLASSAEIATFLAAATATDDVDGTVTVTNDAPGAFFAGTTNTVTFSATDAAGNTGTATATVTVNAYNSGGGSSNSCSSGWCLTVTGNVTTNGITVAIPAGTQITSLPDSVVPTASNSGNIESQVQSAYGSIGTISNFQYNITSSSSTQVVATTSFDVAGALNASYNLTYTYDYSGSSVSGGGSGGSGSSGGSSGGGSTGSNTSSGGGGAFGLPGLLALLFASLGLRVHRQASRATPALALATIALLQASTAQAVPIRFDFTGMVTNVPGNSVFAASGANYGDSFSGWYTFESSVADSNADVNRGQYAYNSLAGMNLTINIGSFTLSTDPTRPDSSLRVLHWPSYDEYRFNTTLPAISGSNGRLFVDAPFVAMNGGVLGSDALPLTPPDLSTLSFNEILINNVDGGQFSGEFTSLTLGNTGAGSGGSLPVPAPASWLLMLAGLAGLRFHTGKPSAYASMQYA